MIEELNGLADKLLRLAEFAAILGALFAGGYLGARRQQARALKPLVGDPPMESTVPLVRQITDLIDRLSRQEDRQDRTERELGDVRDDVTRNTRDLEDVKKLTRGHEDRLGNLETRVFNVERACQLKHRADAGSGVRGGGA